MILQADARHIPLADNSVQCVVTSPPYWCLRDYNVTGQLGLERTPEEYLSNMVAVFREVRRVLREDGTCWVNMGDGYFSQGGHTGQGENSQRKGRSNIEAQNHDNGRKGGKPKDLVGMPWRLAFALQQPYEEHVITSLVDRGWMAGLVDGEGCISCVAVQPTTGINPSHSTRLQIRMADVEAVERVVEITKINSVTYDQSPPSYERLGQRPAQQWKVSGDNMAAIIADIYPFLTVKRRQAVVGWNLQKLKDGIITKRGQPIPEANMEKRRLLFDVLHKLNQREPVDIPSWCDEPAFKVEPGWYLRSDCIWAKPNPMPESVTDRPTKAHEQIFLLTKDARYFFDQEAVRERFDSADEHAKRSTLYEAHGNGETSRGRGNGHNMLGDPTAGRNLRSVWTIPTQPYPEAHFATFPEAIPKRCILAGTSARGCCPVCGAPWGRVVERTAMVIDRSNNHPPELRTRTSGTMLQPATATTTGWKRSCECVESALANGERCYETMEWLSTPKPCIVLDPFAGSGTTVAVAESLGRRGIGLELKAEYIALARKRLSLVTLGLPL